MQQRFQQPSSIAQRPVRYNPVQSAPRQQLGFVRRPVPSSIGPLVATQESTAGGETLSTVPLNKSVGTLAASSLTSRSRETKADHRQAVKKDNGALEIEYNHGLNAGG